MMRTYSHIRREALNQAAAALEPSKPRCASAARAGDTSRGRHARRKRGYVTTHVTKAGFARTTARFSEEIWFAALDDFRNWLIREAA
jgi:hypothetical protein